MFILPIIFKGKKSTEVITEEFINAYIADFYLPEYDDDLLVVFESEVDFDIPVKDILLTEDHFVQIYFIPDEYLDDYLKVIAGDYSSTSNSYKELVLSFWEVDEKSSLYAVLYGLKKDDLEKGYVAKKIKELLPAFKLSEEIYRMGIF
jgi:hypothetical protein